jgi:nicotinate-nucleotide adenylyltransferase
VTQRLGILGGTFDPIHFGHLDAAHAAKTALALDEVRFLPAHDSPLRTAEPCVSAFHRFAMVALAIDDVSAYSVSDAELARQGRSYTIDTLRTLHTQGWQPSQLFFILGADAFADIGAWHAFPAVLDAAHFAVIARPGMTIEAAVARTPQLQARVHDAATEGIRDPGSGIRHPMDEATRIFVVHARTRDVSSTSIRRRLAAGQGVGGMVPSSVARYIAVHHLYRTEDDLHGHDKEKSDA